MTTKLSKRIIAIFLCVMMLCGNFMVTGSAVGTEYTSGNYTYTVSSSKATIVAYKETATGSVEIPEKLGGYPVVKIDEYAFFGCTLIESVTVPTSVKEIGKYAFAYCTTLSSVTIPSSVTSIGEKAFNNSKKVIIYCQKGSYAEKYAKENAIKYINGLSPYIEDIINEEVDFYIDKYNGKVNINFKNSWFEKSPYKYNHELAQFCADYAMLGYGYDEETVKSYLRHAGFNDFYSVSGNMHTGRNEVNYFIASRDIAVNGNIQKLVFIGTIGSYKDQWYSNFDPLGYENAKKDKSLADGGKTHRGFADAREFAYSHLNKYISKLVTDGIAKENIKILLTGHSRGAATANLLAAKLIDNESSFGISRNNIFTYTFATPNVTKKDTTADKYKSIFNIVNPEDFVTKVMLNKWRFSRYGVTYTLPSKTNVGKKNYNNNILPNVSKEFYNYTGKKFDPYKEGEKHTYKIISKMGKNVGSVEALYTDKFWYDLNGLIPRYKDPFTFFKNTLLDYLVNENMSEIIKVALEAGPFYLSIIAYFAWPDIDMDHIHFTIPTYLIDGLADIEIGGKFIMAHQMQTYAAYMNTLSSGQLTEYKAGYENTVNCPVDIEVYDSTGALVGRIVDNVVDETVANGENAIVMDVDGDSKLFWLPSNEEFTVKLLGNDSGTMDYTVATVDSDIGETERVNFFDVAITDGKTMTGEITSADFVLEDYTLELDNGKTLKPTEQTEDVSSIEINVSASGNGTVSKSFTATSGDYVIVSAVADEGYMFTGWYNDSKLVSSDSDYSFVAKDNVILVAKFEIKNGVDSVFIGTDINLNYKKSSKFEPTITLWSSVECTVKYESSNLNVATVDDNGNVYGAGRGEATVTCTVTDELGNVVSDTCKVTVRYTWWQWIIKIVLFGWLWY